MYWYSYWYSKIIREIPFTRLMSAQLSPEAEKTLPHLCQAETWSQSQVRLKKHTTDYCKSSLSIPRTGIWNLVAASSLPCRLLRKSESQFKSKLFMLSVIRNKCTRWLKPTSIQLLPVLRAREREKERVLT